MGLLDSLNSAFYTPQEDPFGIGASVIGASAPGLTSPYQSSGKNIGTAVGAALLAGLLGGYAKKRTNEANQGLLRQAIDAMHGGAGSYEKLSSEPRLAEFASALKASEYESELKNKQERQSKINDLLASSGQVIGDDGAPIQVIDPAKIERNKSRASEAGKIEGQTDARGYNPIKEEETDKLRKDFSALPEVKAYSLVEKASGIINKALADPSAVTDEELVRYAILLIEPGMAVREGEQAAIANSQSIPKAWKGSLAKSLSGKSRLGTEAREGLKQLAKRAFEGHKNQYDRTLSFYQGEAARKGLDPSRVSYIGASTPTEEVFKEVPLPLPKPGQGIAAPDGRNIFIKK